MTQEEILKLRDSAEQTRVQLKERVIRDNKYDVSCEMVAQSNSHGGFIVVGIDDKTGRMNPLSYQEVQETTNLLGSIASDSVLPPILIDTETVAVDGGSLVLATVKESPGASNLDKKAAKIGDFSKKAEKMSVKKAVNYIKMFAMDNLQAPTVGLLANWHIEKHAKVVTDASSSHVNFKDLFDQHEVHNESGSDVDVETIVKTNLPWVHLVAKECRNGIEAIHKEVDRRYLQLYLNEYCWKFNRRFFRDSSNPKYDLFDRLIKISAMYTSDVKYDAAAAEAYNQSDYVDAWGALTDI